jgi:hypothetical protein
MAVVSALQSVRQYGGVLEHPADTKAWDEYGLVRPEFGTWKQHAFGNGGGMYWVTEVWQVDYGHRARKRTWLLYVGVNIPIDMRWDKKQHTACVSGSTNHNARPTNSKNRVWSKEAKATPVAFAEELIRLVGGPQ